MPVERVTVGGQPGYRWGQSGKIYTYTAGSAASRARAYAAATRQGQAARAAGYVEQTFIPPVAVAAAARLALDVRAAKPASQRGMTPVGIARARDLSNRRPLSLDTIARMRDYFSRHAIDKEGATWAEQGPGWQAWNGWGGDAGARWARSVLSSFVVT